MNRHPFSSGARALMTFAGTVVLAVLASVALASPDVAVPAVDALTALPPGLDELLPTSFFE
ncbi:hypothetical protein [Paracidovorax sp. MALMAid1276]|uniref:hypothetical protein n=1 Tax=Paracidovorax sp. MALMAid1276 TaxID=3411631 RepID=UPI003B9AC8E5